MADSADLHPIDFAKPSVLSARAVLYWSEDDAPTQNYSKLGLRLSTAGDVFRNPAYGGGLLLAAQGPYVQPMPVVTPNALAALIVDRVDLLVLKDGRVKGSRIPQGHLSSMLLSELFLQCFRPVDSVTHLPMYLPDFTLSQPGYNDGGIGQRIFYAGPPCEIITAAPAISAFLNAMAFASEADKTNALAAALTVVLRNLWPGAKPIFTVTANRSHAGKDTIVAFAAGRSRTTSITYQKTDWALERSFVGALKLNTDTAVVNIENARLGNTNDVISSGFLERFVMDPQPTLFSTGSGAATTRHNNLVVAITTNFGSLSADLMNRSLPIHLNVLGNIEDRSSAIGNPKLEYLPEKRSAIEAELHGMVQQWRDAGRPLDETVRHPFITWARTIGGILKVNGFNHFLANYSLRKVTADPLRRALGLMGGVCPDQWLAPAEWVQHAAYLGLVNAIVPPADNGSDKGRERGMGMVLTAHEGDTFTTETADETMALRLERARRRFVDGRPSTRYRFVILSRNVLECDGAGSGTS